MTSTASIVENVFLDKLHYERLLSKIDELQEKLSNLENNSENVSEKLLNSPSNSSSLTNLSSLSNNDSDFDENLSSEDPSKNNLLDIHLVNDSDRSYEKKLPRNQGKFMNSHAGNHVTHAGKLPHNGNPLGKKIKKADIRAILKQRKITKKNAKKDANFGAKKSSVSNNDSFQGKKKNQNTKKFPIIQELASNWLKL